MKIIEEIWKDIPNYEGFYQISNYGNIKRLHKRKNCNLVKPAIKRGYYQVGLRKKGTRKYFQVHRLVAQAFITNPDNLPQVNHKDENKLNNYIDNLEWCTVEYNNTYGTRLKRVAETNKLKRAIIQFDLNGNIIAEYPSLCEAARKNGIDVGNVHRSCNTKNFKPRKYLFKYKEEAI